VSAITETATLKGARKAAILLTMLGDDAAAEVFRILDEDELRRVADEVSTLGPVSMELSIDIFEEYLRMLPQRGYSAAGGADVARRLLVKALGEEEAHNMFSRLSRSRESSPLERLQRADSQKLAKFLEGEHPQTIALMLGQLGERQASSLLMSLPMRKRAEAIRRLAELRKFSPEMAERVSLLLSQRLKGFGEPGKRAYSGFQSVADIMNSVDSTVAQEILEQIEQEQPSLAFSIRDLMFTFNDLLEVSEVHLRELVAAVDKRQLAIALKGTSENLREHFFRTMSSRAVEMLKEDIEAIGPIRSKDVQKAQSEIVVVARRLEVEGKIVLKGDASDEYVV
jgi:flagellar motor switch protein FliG